MDGYGWESLGVYTAPSGTMVVKLGDNANGDVIANAIQIVPVAPVTTAPLIVDNAQAGYAESGSGWLGWSDPSAFWGDFRYHPPGDGSDVASWTFPALDPTQQYNVYVTYTPAANRATDSPFSVYDTDTLLGTTSVDQQLAPADATIGGCSWASLGTYTRPAASWS